MSSVRSEYDTRLNDVSPPYLPWVYLQRDVFLDMYKGQDIIIMYKVVHKTLILNGSWLKYCEENS